MAVVEMVDTNDRDEEELDALLHQPLNTKSVPGLGRYASIGLCLVILSIVAVCNLYEIFPKQHAMAYNGNENNKSGSLSLENAVDKIEQGIVASPIQTTMAPTIQNSTVRNDHPNCQIIYVVGVEGSTHHGSTDVITKFAKSQRDENGKPFVVYKEDDDFRKLIKWHQVFGYVVSDQERQKQMEKLCPKDDGRHHVIIEDCSFPAGYNRRNSSKWGNMTAEEIAIDLQRDPHPVDLLEFAETFSRYAQVRFIVLHRPYINTVVSHIEFDKTTDRHASVVSGNLIYLGNMLRQHQPSLPPFTVLCVDQLKQSNNNNNNQNQTGRTPRVKNLEHLATFMQWPQTDCQECFKDWRDSSKDPQQLVSPEDYQLLLDEREKLKDIWPPIQPKDRKDCPL